jgi:hypothetical protein
MTEEIAKGCRPVAADPQPLELFKEFGVFQLLPDSGHGMAALTVCLALNRGFPWHQNELGLPRSGTCAS